MRRTAEEAEQTRRALLEAALLTFEERGWRGATFEVVAARAGVTRGALHHHFSSKVVLLEDALAWGWAEYGTRLLDVEPADLAALLPEFVHLLREDARFRALAACTVLVAPQALGDTAGKNAALDAWRDRIAAGLPATSESTPEAVAALALVLVQGLTVTAVMRPDDLPRPGELGATISALARGLRPA